MDLYRDVLWVHSNSNGTSLAVGPIVGFAANLEVLNKPKATQFASPLYIIRANSSTRKILLTVKDQFEVQTLNKLETRNRYVTPVHVPI